MEARERRYEIEKILRGQDGPISASKLAGYLQVSRQVIVGDIALLRAAGCGIVATARGYLLADNMATNRYVGKVACHHDREGTREELCTIVDLGGCVLDVVVTHDLYGEISGQLNLGNRGDVDEYLDRVSQGNARLLSELTGGVHLHTIACRDATVFDKIVASLGDKGFLFRD